MAFLILNYYFVQVWDATNSPHVIFKTLKNMSICLQIHNILMSVQSFITELLRLGPVDIYVTAKPWLPSGELQYDK